MQVSWIDADHVNALLAQIAPQELTESTKESPGNGMEGDQESVIDFASEISSISLDWMTPMAEKKPAAEVESEVHRVSETPAHELMVGEDEEGAGAVDAHGNPLHNPAAALPLSRIREKLRAIRQRATDAGILVRSEESVCKPQNDSAASTVEVSRPPMETEAAPEENVDSVKPLDDGSADPGCTEQNDRQAPAFETPRGSRDERLAAFAVWARGVLHEDGGHVLVLSDDGEVLWGGDARPGLMLSTMMAWSAAVRATAGSASGLPTVIRQRLASGNVLTVIPCDTTSGVYHAAVAAPAALSEDVASKLRDALLAAMRYS